MSCRLGQPAPLGTGHGGTDSLAHSPTVVTAGPTEALTLGLRGGGGSVGVGTWAEAGGTGALVRGGPTSHCEDGETEAQRVAGACQGHLAQEKRGAQDPPGEDVGLQRSGGQGPPFRGLTGSGAQPSSGPGSAPGLQLGLGDSRVKGRPGQGEGPEGWEGQRSGRPGCGREGLLPRWPPGPARPFPASKDALGDTGPWPPGLDLTSPHTPGLLREGTPRQGAPAALPLCSCRPGFRRPHRCPWPAHLGRGTVPALTSGKGHPARLVSWLVRRERAWHVTHCTCRHHLWFQDSCTPQDAPLTPCPCPGGHLSPCRPRGLVCSGVL